MRNWEDRESWMWRVGKRENTFKNVGVHVFVFYCVDQIVFDLMVVFGSVVLASLCYCNNRCAMSIKCLVIQ